MAHKWLCGVPIGHCNGGRIQMCGMELRAHSSPGEAFRCYVRYVTTQRGWQPTANPREFRRPDTGTVEMLTKRSRFGVRIKQGKTHQDMGHRGNPDEPHHRGWIFCD